jgi:hypothetical protein
MTSQEPTIEYSFLLGKINNNDEPTTVLEYKDDLVLLKYYTLPTNSPSSSIFIPPICGDESSIYKIIRSSLEPEISNPYLFLRDQNILLTRVSSGLNSQLLPFPIACEPTSEPTPEPPPTEPDQNYYYYYNVIINPFEPGQLPSYTDIEPDRNKWVFWPGQTGNNIRIQILNENNSNNLAYFSYPVNDEPGTESEPVGPNEPFSPGFYEYVGVRNGIYSTTTFEPQQIGLKAKDVQDNLAQFTFDNTFIQVSQDNNSIGTNQAVAVPLGEFKDFCSSTNPVPPTGKNFYVYVIGPNMNEGGNISPFLAYSPNITVETSAANQFWNKQNEPENKNKVFIINSNKSVYTADLEPGPGEILLNSSNNSLTYKFVKNTTEPTTTVDFTHIAGPLFGGVTPDPGTSHLYAEPTNNLEWDSSNIFQINNQFLLYPDPNDQGFQLNGPFLDGPEGDKLPVVRVICEPSVENPGFSLQQLNNTTNPTAVDGMNTSKLNSGILLGSTKNDYFDPVFNSFNITDLNSWVIEGGDDAYFPPYPNSSEPTNPSNVNYRSYFGFLSPEPQPQEPGPIIEANAVFLEKNNNAFYGPTGVPDIQKNYLSVTNNEPNIPFEPSFINGLKTAEQIFWGVAKQSSNINYQEPQSLTFPNPELPAFNSRTSRTIYPNFIGGDSTVVVDGQQPSDINGEPDNFTGTKILFYDTNLPGNKTIFSNTKFFLINEAEVAKLPTEINPILQNTVQMYDLLPYQYIQAFEPNTGTENPIGGQYFLPGKFPAGDYKGSLVFEPAPGGGKLVQDFPVILASRYEAFPDSKQPNMTADQCRFCWRQSHFTRSLGPSSEKDDLNQVTKSASDALAFVGLREGNIAIGVTLWSLKNTAGAQNSADMVPPVLASIDARGIQSGNTEPTTYPAIEPSTGYSSFNYRNNAIYKNMPEPQNAPPKPGTVDEPTACDAVFNEVWPFYDSLGGGGQQIGIAGSGWGCNLELLNSDKFNVMKFYDLYNNNSYEPLYNTNLNHVYNSAYNNAKDINEEPIGLYTESDIENFCKGFKLALYRGNGFNNFNDWPSGIEPGPSYATLIGSKAYACNMRIRNINIQEKDELAFGVTDTFQPLTQENVKSWIPGTTEPSTGDSNGYVPTYFPIYGLPESGWGAITEEIFSYQGISAVIRNDYNYFCRWHRCLYYLLYYQNGGNMFNWNEGEPDPIFSTASDLGGTGTPPLGYETEPGQFPYWLPSYLKNENAGNEASQIWVGQGDPLNKNYTIYPEGNGGDGPAWPVEAEPDTNSNKTLFWANRWDPYRGQGIPYEPSAYKSTRRIQWSTPAYTMGYSPVWVAAGKTDINCNCYPYEPSTAPGIANYNSSTALTHQNTNSELARPVAECLNPYYSGEGGLYSASDGDQNIYLAYKLASLRWQNDIEPANLDPGSDDHIKNEPTGGFNCDVADFYGVSTAYSVMGSNDNTSKAAYNYFGSPLAGGFLPNPASAGNPTTSLHNIIGYGVDKDNQPLKYNSKKVTTWGYIADSIRNTLVSQNGTGWADNYGNFATNGSLQNRRIVTLGHDTGGSPIKVDYIDPRLYEIGKTTNDIYKEQWEQIFNDNVLVIQNTCGNQIGIPIPK